LRIGFGKGGGHARSCFVGRRIEGVLLSWVFGIEHIVHAVVLIRRSFACLDKNNNHRVLFKITPPHAVLVSFLPSSFPDWAARGTT
jgi:hypothetical protein